MHGAAPAIRRPLLEAGPPSPELQILAALRRRLPRPKVAARLWRRSPQNLLAGAIVRVRVVTVKRDAAGQLKAESLWYSKIDEVISIVAGTPPALREVKS